MQNNDLTRFNEGGTHEQNPLGGVPVGNGNTVEAGETKMKNYVYFGNIWIVFHELEEFYSILIIPKCY